jgi:N-methylhydantoinase B/oxoprolinase/acetone carboxylase alpha subunit
MFDRITHPARGRDGGGAGGKGAARLDDGTIMRGMGREIVPAGRRLVVETPGGGGIGAPADRAAEALAVDVRAGFVSEEAARDLYRRETPRRR